jgi:uncharacterized protein (TIGR02231 family)
MKICLLRMSAVAAAILSIVRAAPVAADSRITAVTVYTDRAVVTRTAAVTLTAPGPVEVTFEKLPAAVVDQSLTVAGNGTAQATILDVTARASFVSATPNERVKAAEDALKALQRQRRVQDDRGSVLKAQEASLDRLEAAATSAPTKDSAPRLSIEESTKLLAFLEEQRTKLATERQSLDGQIEDLQAKQSAAERTLAELRGGGGRSYKTVVVRLDAATAGQLDLALSYAVPGASWTPSYDARVNSGEHAIALGYFGLVRQNTGEDWKDVALTLSTARPGLGGAAPQLVPWAVDVLDVRAFDKLKSEQQAAGRNLRFGYGGVNAPNAALNMQTLTNGGSGGWSAGSVSLGVVEERKDAGYYAAEVSTAATSASFRIATASTVLSDNAPQKVPVTTANLAANPEYLTVPKQVTTAYLTAKVANNSEFPLLAGMMNVFLDGTFVATSPLRTVMPGEKFDLALGADEGISVKHKRVNRFAEETGLTNSGKRVTYEYLITIQNNKKTAERVIVADQVPVSRNEKVIVKLLAPAEKEMKPTNDGTMKWTLDLKPGEKREVTLKFSVENPNDVQVTGLES